MLLQDILSRVTVEEHKGELNIPISGVNIDSRRIEKDHLFIAVKGTQVDGHSFIDKAISQGATAVLVCDPIPEVIPEGVTYNGKTYETLSEWDTSGTVSNFLK